MIDLDARADRVRAIVEGNFGRVIDRNGDTMVVEVPADVSIGLNCIWGEGGFAAIVRGQFTKLAPRRVIAENGMTVVCENDPRDDRLLHHRGQPDPARGGKVAPTPGRQPT